MENKGYIRTLEAITAVLIIFLFTTSVIISQDNPNKAIVPQDIQLTQDAVLKEIQTSRYYRDCILEKNMVGSGDIAIICTEDLLKKTVPSVYGYAFSLCTSESCTLPTTPDKEIYVKSIIISSNLTDYNLISVNLYLWKKV